MRLGFLSTRLILESESIEVSRQDPTIDTSEPRAGSYALCRGQKVAQGRVEQSVPMIFSGDETCDVGRKPARPVSPDYGPADNAFSGITGSVDLDNDDHDHMISPEERFRVARQ